MLLPKASRLCCQTNNLEFKAARHTTNSTCFDSVILKSSLLCTVNKQYDFELNFRLFKNCKNCQMFYLLYFKVLSQRPYGCSVYMLIQYCDSGCVVEVVCYINMLLCARPDDLPF